ncbi:hypothetical protein AA0482_1455 [Acetobacter cibinongensis NRIC 0482]|nr:hypothetical protein AA0482_1455 [Acetobacter cibinongensis NRIC 0482]
MPEEKWGNFQQRLIILGCVGWFPPVRQGRPEWFGGNGVAGKAELGCNTPKRNIRRLKVSIHAGGQKVGAVPVVCL